MQENKRIRVVFKDDDILSDTQKLEGLNRSWLLLRQQHVVVSDIASHLLHAFQLHQSCPRGLLLSISGFALPPFESTSILKGNEIVRVRKRRNGISLEGNNAACEREKLGAVTKQPVNNGVLLLANVEFEKEKGGYESDDTGEEDNEELLHDIENPSGGNADSRKRKLKAAEKLHGSKKKKLRSEAPEDVANGVHKGNIGSSSRGGVCPKKKLRLEREKESDSSCEDDVENDQEGAKIGDKGDKAMPGVKRNAEVQENSKKTDDAKIAPAETKKVPSRNARRKYAKRKFLREMAKIQKQNATCESEGLKNWKEDHAKSEKKKGPPVWKIQQADAEKMGEDGQPKELLHWKESHQNTMHVKGRKHQREHRIVSFHKPPNQDGDVAQTMSSTETFSKEAEAIVKEAIKEQTRFLQHEKPNQNVDTPEQSNRNFHEQTNEINGNFHEKTNQPNGNAHRHPNQDSDTSEQSNQEDDGEKEVVPIVIRPGHIRFEPLEKDQTIQQNHVPLDTFQWNGITSKKKGQKWGTEKYSFSPRNDYKISNKDQSELPINYKEKLPDVEIDFEKLPPLPCAPKVGNLIAYRLLELSSCWTPELSEFRVGKVIWYNAKSDKTLLAPVPEFPIVSKTDEDEDVVPDNSLYKEDGSLEIDFTALIGVRIIEDESGEPRKEASTHVNEVCFEKENAPKLVSPSSNPVQTLEPSAGKDGADPWDQISEALNQKKDELTKESSWGKPTKPLQVAQVTSFGENPKYVKQSSTNNWGKNFKNGQQSEQNSRGKNAKNGQASQKNSRRKYKPEDLVIQWRF